MSCFAQDLLQHRKKPVIASVSDGIVIPSDGIIDNYEDYMMSGKLVLWKERERERESQR